MKQSVVIRSREARNPNNLLLLVVRVVFDWFIAASSAQGKHGEIFLYFSLFIRLEFFI